MLIMTELRNWLNECKEHCDNLWQELGWGQNNGKVFQDTTLVIILLLAFDFSGYSGSRGTNLMLEWNYGNSLVVLFFLISISYDLNVMYEPLPNGASIWELSNSVIQHEHVYYFERLPSCKASWGITYPSLKHQITCPSLKHQITYPSLKHCPTTCQLLKHQIMYHIHHLTLWLSSNYIVITQ